MTITTGFRSINDLTTALDFTEESLEHTTIWNYLDCIMGVAQNHTFGVALELTYPLPGELALPMTQRIGPFRMNRSNTTLATNDAWPRLYERRASGVTNSGFATDDHAFSDDGHLMRGMLVNNHYNIDTKGAANSMVVNFQMDASDGVWTIEILGYRAYEYDVVDPGYRKVRARLRHHGQVVWESQSLAQYHFTLMFYNLDYMPYANAAEQDALGRLVPGCYRLRYQDLVRLAPDHTHRDPEKGEECHVCFDGIYDLDYVLATVHPPTVHCAHYFCMILTLTETRRCWCNKNMEGSINVAEPREFLHHPECQIM